MENIKSKLEEKMFVRKSIEDRIIDSIRKGKPLANADLNTIYALSLTISTLEELIPSNGNFRIKK